MKIILTILAMIFALPAFAEPDFGEITVVDGGRQPDGTQLFGINITLKDGWHTYWRLAGQNGLDPVFNFEGSENLQSYEIHWPEPRLVGEEGTEAVGYYDGVEIVVSMMAEDQQKPIKISLNMDIGVCDVQCVPVHREYAMELIAGYSIDGIGLKQVTSDAFDDGQDCDRVNYTVPTKDIVFIEASHDTILIDTKELYTQGEIKIPSDIQNIFSVNSKGMKSVCN